MAVITVPRTPKRAFNPKRRPSALLLKQIEHLEWAVLPASKRKPHQLKNVPKVRTEAQAAERVGQLTKLVMGVDPGAPGARAMLGPRGPRAAAAKLPPLPRVKTAKAAKPAATKARRRKRVATTRTKVTAQKMTTRRTKAATRQVKKTRKTSRPGVRRRAGR